MKYIKRINEEFWPFKKSKEDDDLVNNILKKLSELKSSDITEDEWNDLFEFTFDGDKFVSGENYLEVNNKELKCSDNILNKFYSFIESKYNEEEILAKKETQNKLRNKYK